MMASFEKIVLFLDQYPPESIVLRKNMLKISMNVNVMDLYLSQLIRAGYVDKLGEKYYKVVKKVSPNTSIANIIFEGDEIEKHKREAG